ncbi:putative angiotensin-converting enzyme 2 [Lupinus albus]|uniref:Putative angiotensin-converting enzyme 2 n=1 Tax=Lupinus albus TaxID=3870 RepID=A0A6A4NZU2_LUPAL|nr:putative angiotensin-converting enzyme 2 [Lupinus albus]
MLFVDLVWQKLEEENDDFFRAYYIRLKLKKQILLFNHLLEHQYHLMKCPMPAKVPLAPMQNGMHPMPGKFSPSWLCVCKLKLSQPF